MRGLGWLCLVWMLGAAGQVAAQEPSPLVAPVQDEVDPVTLTGRTPDLAETVETVSDYVADVGGAPRGNNLARWDARDELCTSVLNLDLERSIALIDRIAEVSRDIGLTPGRAGCRPNLVILVDDDPSGLARRLVRGSPRAFRPDFDDTNRGVAALQRFQSSDAPVRWWHVTYAAHPETGELIPDGAGGGAPSSRFTEGVVQELTWIIVIVDGRRMDRVDFESFADYLALVSLIQVDDRAETADWNTVLNLFEPGAPPDLRLTSWDQDFLQGLYASDGDRRQGFQAVDIGYALEAVREARRAGE